MASAAATGGPSSVTICATVFAPGDVSRIVGAELAPPRPGRPSSRVARCLLEKRGADGRAVAMALAMIDCRGLGLEVASHRAKARAMVARGGTYRDVALGKGDTEVPDTKPPTYTITFVDDRVPCWATGSTAFVADDHVEALARWVHDRLPGALPPRR